MTRSALRFSVLLAGGVFVGAAAPSRQLQEAERDSAAQTSAQRKAVESAYLAEADETRLAGERVIAAAAMRSTETAVASLATDVEGLTARHRDAAQRLAERAAALAPLLPLIERLALYPVETMLAVPAAPQATLRGLAVLRGLARQLERDAAALRAEQAQVQALMHEIAVALPRLQAAQAAQAVHATALDRQIVAARVSRSRAEDAAAVAARQAATEAARADSLRGALAAMEAERARAEAQARDEAMRAGRQRQNEAAAEARRRQVALSRPAGPGIEQRGVLTAPVAGQVVRGWGDRTDAGPSSGMSYRAPPMARVVAPCGGRVVFAGPFRSFGIMLIVDCGGGFHFVLAGLDRLDAQVGNTVLAGEPIGVMPNWEPQSAGPRPALYVQLRRDGQAVNPAPFLRTRG